MKLINPYKEINIEDAVELFKSKAKSTDIESLSLSVDGIIPDLKDEPKAQLWYSPAAYMKQNLIIHKCPKEVAWHGLVRKIKRGVYYVYDILLYPQEVTAGAVDATDDYQVWVTQLTAEQLNARRFQAHSHVNMAVNPSTTDQEYFNSILGQVRDFYILGILNKKGERNLAIYDFDENIAYTNDDIETEVGHPEKGIGLIQFINESLKENITEKVRVSTITTSYQSVYDESRFAHHFNNGRDQAKSKSKKKGNKK